MWCSSRSARRRSAIGGDVYTLVPQRRGPSEKQNWIPACAGMSGEHPSKRQLVNLAGPVVTNKANIVAVDAVNAGDLGEALPARAPVFGDLLVDRIDIGRIGKDAAGIVAGHTRPGAGEFRAIRQGFGTAGQ